MLIGFCDMQMFNQGDMQQAGIPHAWLCKAKMHHDDRDFAAARATAAAALAALESANNIPSPALGAESEELTLILYSSLWELGDTVGAAAGFKKIAGTPMPPTPDGVCRSSPAYSQPGSRCLCIVKPVLRAQRVASFCMQVLRGTSKTPLPTGAGQCAALLRPS